MHTDIRPYNSCDRRTRLEDTFDQLKDLGQLDLHFILIIQVYISTNLKPVISPSWLDRLLPNFAGRRTEAIDMFPMSFNL